MRALAPALVLLCACPNPQPSSGCGPSTCMGCCDPQGVCQLGQTTAACGADGEMCTPCGAGLSCSAGVCGTTAGAGGGSSATGGGSSGTGGGSSGTGGGSSGTGGGSSGTGGGSAMQTGQNELVSGSRLRAINWASADGAKAPYGGRMFWDTQLSTYCLVGLNIPDPIEGYFPYCLPVSMGGREGGVFSDPGCTVFATSDQRTAYVSSLLVDAGLPPVAPYVQLDDGGYATGIDMGPGYQRPPTGSGCVASPAHIYAPGTPAPLSSFVKLGITRD